MKRWLSTGYLPLRSTIFPLAGVLLLMGLAEGALLWLLRKQPAPLEALFALPATVVYFAAMLAVFCLLLLRYSGGAATLGRLNVSPMEQFFLWGGWSALCFFGVMAWQVVLFLLLGTVYFHAVPEAAHPQALMLAVYRSRLLYTLLPLWEPLRYLCNLVMCVNLGFSAALLAFLRRVRRWHLVPILSLALVFAVEPGSTFVYYYGAAHLVLAVFCVQRWRRSAYEKA